MTSRPAPPCAAGLVVAVQDLDDLRTAMLQAIDLGARDVELDLSSLHVVPPALRCALEAAVERLQDRECRARAVCSRAEVASGLSRVLDARVL